MTRHRPGSRVRLRRGRVAHIVASTGERNPAPTTPRFTLCGVPVLPDDQPATADDPACQGCYDRTARKPRRHRP